MKLVAPLAREARVDAGVGNVLVAEEVLGERQVGAGVHEVDAERVLERVEVPFPLRDPGGPAVGLHHRVEALATDGVPIPRDKDRRRRTAAGGRDERPEELDFIIPEELLAGPAPLEAPAEDLPPAEIHVAGADHPDLACAEAVAVGHKHDRAIAPGVDRLQEPPELVLRLVVVGLDVVHRQMSRT